MRSSTCLNSETGSEKLASKTGELHTQHIEDLVIVVHLRSSFEQRLDSLVWAFDRFGNLVNILWLDNRLEIILQNLGEVIYLRLVAAHD